MRRHIRIIGKVLFGIVVYLLAVLASAAVVRAGEPAPAGDALWQVSTIDALLDGVYEGAATVDEMLGHGDFGLGTFDALDGEMVVLDGTVWRVRADGRPYAVPGGETTPFAQVTTFEEDFRVVVPRAASIKELFAALGAALPNPNVFYAVRARGRFDHVRTRSVPRQKAPYPPLAEVAAQQPQFELAGTSGDVIGFYGPAFIKGVGVPGFHLHYLTDTRDAGGHMLDIRFDGPVAFSLDATPAMQLVLPQHEAFAATDLSRDRHEELRSVEQ